MIHKLFTYILLLAFISGCGYLPASKQARKVVGKDLFVEVVVSLKDPENAVIIKDATRRAVITRFHASLVPASQAKTKLLVEISSIGFSPLQYDENGYVIVYRTRVTLRITRQTDTAKKLYSTQGTFDFTIEPNALITDTQRFDAITSSSIKALDNFIAEVGAEGTQI